MKLLAEFHSANVKRREARGRGEEARRPDGVVIAVATRDLVIIPHIISQVCCQAIKPEGASYLIFQPGMTILSPSGRRVIIDDEPVIETDLFLEGPRTRGV